MNTPDNCYLDKGHSAHDLLGPGEVCKACGFVTPEPDETAVKPAQRDRDEAKAVVWHDDWPDHTITEGGGKQAIAMIAEAIARARAAERERIAAKADALFNEVDDIVADTMCSDGPDGHCDGHELIARRVIDHLIAAAIRSLPADATGGT